MVNSVYGKTCENQLKRSKIELVTRVEELNKRIEKPHFKRYKLFGSENLAGTECRNQRVTIDKPFYIGFSVLEVSKLHVYRFHYDYVLPKYGENARLLFTDTDSLMYWVKTSNIYDDMWADRNRFDLASFDKASKYHDATNDRVIGKMKDETAGNPILEFVGLRPKMYSFLTADHKDKCRAKGVARVAQRNLHYDQFKLQLNIPAENKQENVTFRSKLHQEFTLSMMKRGLCAFDDKRFIMDDGVTSRAYGHYKITRDVEHVCDEVYFDNRLVFGQSKRSRKTRRKMWHESRAKRMRTVNSYAGFAEVRNELDNPPPTSEQVLGGQTCTPFF